MKILITGTTSGFGMYAAHELAEKHEVVCWARDNFGDCSGIKNGVKTILHCAHDHRDYAANIEMLHKLYTVPHMRLIYLSSIDVYQRNPTEYALSKRACEAEIRTQFDDYVILRLPMLIGPTMRKNNIIKMLLGEQMSLSPFSKVSCLDYETVLWALPLQEKKEQNMMVITSDICKLGCLAKSLGLEPLWGEHIYETASISGGFGPTIDVIKDFLPSLWFKRFMANK